MKTRTIPNLDLLIIDIDDTFIYHRTVAIANKLFLDATYRIFGKQINNNEIYTTKKSIFLIIKLITFNFYRFNPTIKKIKPGFLLSVCPFC